MAHERSATVTLKKGKKKKYANIDTVGEDRRRVLGGRTFNNMDDAIIEAQTRSRFGHDQPRRNPAARKNPRDRNKPRNPIRKYEQMRRPNNADG